MVSRIRLADVDGLASGIDRLAGWLRRQVPPQISLSAISVLDRLASEGPLRVSDIAVREATTQPGATLIVKRLAAAGYAQRVSDPTDRRVTLVSITEPGRALLADRRAARARILRERLARLDDEDRALLTAALPAIERLVREPADTTQRSAQR